MSDARDMETPEFPGDTDEIEETGKPFSRDRDLLGRKDSKLRKYLDKLFDQIMRGWQDQANRSDNQMDWWDTYFCKLNRNQFYDGNAEIYVPIIRDAINARATRFVNQLFPASGRYIDVTTSDGKQPWEIIGLLSHYIRQGKLKTKVFKPLSRNGDIEGQYNLYVDWREYERQIVSRETHAPQVSMPGASPVDLPDEPDIPDIVEEDVTEGCPVCEVLHDADVLVSPATSDSIDEALEVGGFVVIARRWTEEKVKAMAAAGEIDDGEADDLCEQMTVEADKKTPNPEKRMVEAVGIQERGKVVLVWEVWHKLTLNQRGEFAGRGTGQKGGRRRLCRIWFGPDRAALGAKRNPFWNDRCPLLSEPVEKQSGSFKGQSLVEPVASMQYEANDAANEMADADHYGALPIVAVDPDFAGQAPLIMNVAAIWQVKPESVKFMEFPDLGQRGLRRIQAAMAAIMRSLGVNPAMITSQSSGKLNQAEIANEQQVDLLTTAEAASVLADGIGTPMLGWMVDLDHQFRDADLTIRQYGIMGIEAKMMDVAPLQNRHRYLFSWCGAEEARLNIAMQQQGTAFINVARGLRQEIQAEGYQLRLGPMLEKAALNIFGAQTGSQTLIDMRHTMSIPPNQENELLEDGFDLPVQPLDQDLEHLKAHQPLMQTGDPHGVVRMHIALHLKQLQAKQQIQMQQAAMQSMQQQGAPGVPGGAGPGVAGTPRPPMGPGMPQAGVAPAGPRLMRGPPGMIRPDNLPLQMPRRN